MSTTTATHSAVPSVDVTAGSTPAAELQPNTVVLDFPVMRGTETIKSVTLRKPNAGALRGIKLTELLQMDVSSLQLLLPRVTTPTLLRHEVEALDPADLTALGTELVSFFVRRSIREEFQTT